MEAMVSTDRQQIPAPSMGAGQGGGDAAEGSAIRDDVISGGRFSGFRLPVAATFTPSQPSPIEGEGLNTVSKPLPQAIHEVVEILRIP
jgi:hypothetical protein